MRTAVEASLCLSRKHAPLIPEAAWKEDNRRSPNNEAFTRTIALTMASPVSRTWKGYWQRSPERAFAEGRIGREDARFGLCPARVRQT